MVSRTIANCLYRRGRMVEEWVVRDSLAIALQPGQDPDELARTKAFPGYTGSFTQPAPADVIAVGDSGPRPDDYRPEVELVLDLIQRVWNDRDLEKVDDFFARDLVLQTIGNRTVIRPEGYRRQLLTMLRPFPGGQFEVRDVATNSDVRYAGLRVAVVWKFFGEYNGAADFGPLTGPRSTSSASPSSSSRTAGSCARCGSTTRSRCAPRSPPAAATCRTPAPTSTDRLDR